MRPASPVDKTVIQTYATKLTKFYVIANANFY